VSLGLHIDTTVSASDDGFGSRSLSPLHLSLTACLRPTSTLVPGSPATRHLLGKGAGCSVSKIIAIASASKPAPVTWTSKPAVKRASVIKDSSMVTEVSAGEVASAATQETLQSKEDTGNENDDGKGNNDDEGDH
ncbi:hypothetical protein C0995_000947, partial [Termitomyces sp. Mi166